MAKLVRRLTLSREDSIEALRAAMRLCRPGDEVQLVTTPDFSAGGNAVVVVAVLGICVIYSDRYM